MLTAVTGIAIALVTALLAPSPLYPDRASPSAGAAGTGRDATPFQAALLPLPSGHYALEVQLNGTGPYLFTLDTAASHSAVIQAVAEQHGFVSQQTELSPIQTLTRAISTERFSITSLTFAGLRVENTETIVMPGPPAVGVSSVGLIGANALEGRRIRLDHKARRLWVNAPRPGHEDGQVDPVFNILIGEARVSGAPLPVQVLVDTGSARTLVNPWLAQWLDRRRTGEPVQIGGASGGADLIDSVSLIRIDGLQVGGLCTDQLIALEADVDIFRALGWRRSPAIILGMDVLEAGVLTIDYETGRFELSPADGVSPCQAGRVQRASQS